VSAPEGEVRICARPECDQVLPVQIGRGRPRIYCSADCRGTTTANGGVLKVEVDHIGADDDDARPLGRVWLVRLRRGSNEVIVAAELGRPSADHLAGQIAQLIDRRQRAQEPPWSRQNPRSLVVD
jgi:hypothetical protein